MISSYFCILEIQGIIQTLQQIGHRKIIEVHHPHIIFLKKMMILEMKEKYILRKPLPLGIFSY